jgi:hypothetical protein
LYGVILKNRIQKANPITVFLFNKKEMVFRKKKMASTEPEKSTQKPTKFITAKTSRFQPLRIYADSCTAICSFWRGLVVSFSR